LPQGAVVGPTLRQSRLFQLGEHSTLFVLNADSLACTETVYLGHKAGAVLVPPVAALEQLIFVESPADDYSLLQALATDPKTKRWTPAGQPRRLKGRVLTPPAVSGSCVAVTTDLGQVGVYQIEPANAEPLRQIASVAATETTPLVTFAELERNRERNRLWTAGRRRTMYEVQESLAQLTLRWTENHDDRFLAPLELQGDVLIVARRRSGVEAVLLEGCKASSGELLWTTQIAAPLIALVPNSVRQTVEALTAAGQLYSLPAKSFEEGRAEKPAFPAKSESFSQASLAADGQLLVWNRPQSGQVYVYDARVAAKPIVISLPAAAAAPAVAMEGGVVAPLVDGRVVWLPLAATGVKFGPFMPPLAPDALPLWTKPVVVEGGQSFLISDGRGTVYAVAQKDQPQPHLAVIGQSPTSGAVTSLVWTGSAAIGVLRQGASDAVVGFDSRAAAAFEPLPLAGRVEAGPFAVGGLALVVAEPDGLVCLTSEGNIRWKQALQRGPLAGSPLALGDGDVLVVYQAGDVCRIDAVSGKELACHEMGQPLLGPACIFESNVYLSGSDGVVHRVWVPPRP
jgi:outer membrane protein assembly factor BamB